MIGAITGDIAGSRFEWDNYRKKDFELLSEKCFPTDDSYMTLAVADALTRCRDDLTDLGVMAAESMRRIGRRYPDGGYGRRFKLWLMSDDMGPYQSMGNGAAMRVSACGYAAWSSMRPERCPGASRRSRTTIRKDLKPPRLSRPPSIWQKRDSRRRRSAIT